MFFRELNLSLLVDVTILFCFAFDREDVIIFLPSQALKDNVLITNVCGYDLGVLITNIVCVVPTSFVVLSCLT